MRNENKKVIPIQPWCGMAYPPPLFPSSNSLPPTTICKDRNWFPDHQTLQPLQMELEQQVWLHIHAGVVTVPYRAQNRYHSRSHGCPLQLHSSECWISQNTVICSNSITFRNDCSDRKWSDSAPATTYPSPKYHNSLVPQR